jgi:LPXTG-motif cell wall-anchored protein
MFHFRRKKSIALLLTVCFLFVMVMPGYAAGTEVTGNSLQDARDGIVGYYSKNKTNLGTWREVVALNAAGQDVSTAPWTLPDWKADQLNEKSQPTDYAGKTLSMLAAGQNPKDVGGRDLVAELAAKQKDDGSFSSLINQQAWAVIALDTAGGNYDIGKAMEVILTKQKADGGFGLFGDTADPDITGEVLMAIAPHKDIAGVSAVVNKAIECLKKMQLSDGGFASWGQEAPESAAAVIRGLLACGEKNITSGDWQQEKGNMIDALFSFQLEDGSFVHATSETKYNGMATEQALQAVADMVTAGITYTVKTGQRHTGDEAAEATVRVRVEGLTESLADKTVTVTEGTALDALKAAVGEQNVVAPDDFITSILDESGKQISGEISTSWMYYVIRDGSIEQGAFSEGAGDYNVRDEDQVIFYNGAMDSTWAPKTFFPVVSIDPQSPLVGQDITMTIKAMKYDWMAGLVELTAEELESIGEYTVMVGDKQYNSQNGKVTFTAAEAGSLPYIITNKNETGYPDVVTYKGSINVIAGSKDKDDKDVITPSDDPKPGDPQDVNGTDQGQHDKTGGTDQQDKDMKNGSNPKTGDNNTLFFLATAVLLGAGALIVIVRRKVLT